MSATGSRRYLDPGTGLAGLPAITVKNGLLRVEYIRRRNADDIRYEVEFCSDLSGWAAATARETVFPVDEEWERVIVLDEPPPDGGPRFGRVVAVLAP